MLGGEDGSGEAEPEGPLLLADSTAAVRLAAAVALASAMRSSWAQSRICWRSEPLVTVTVRDLNFRGQVSQRRLRLLWTGSSLKRFHSSFHSWGHSAIDCGLLEGPAGSGCEPWLGWLASSVMSAAVRLQANCARLSSSMAVSWKAATAGDPSSRGPIAASSRAEAALGEAVGGLSMQRGLMSMLVRGGSHGSLDSEGYTVNDGWDS